MSFNTTATEMYLALPDSRTLAYEDVGDPSSSTIVLFFHGAFGVGKASKPLPTLLEKGVHYVAPTLPGWGKSSPRNKNIPYHITLANDITALIDHLHPNKDGLEIYISGGSYGTVPAQMLYGASFDVFPSGRYLKGCMILAPFSPLREHKDSGKSMTFMNYMMVGPPSQIIPFKIVPRIASLMIGSKMKSVEGAEAVLRAQIFDHMDDAERATFAKWREENGKAEGELERDFGENMFRSVHETWDGFMEIPDVAHGDWGFSPSALDDVHNGRPIFIVSSEGDTLAPDAMAKWLAATYKNAHYRSVSGGHLAAIYVMDDLWKEFFGMC